DFQNGFRKNRSCEDHILSLYNIINDRNVKRKPTFICFVDFKRAFDGTQRHKLWHKLRKIPQCHTCSIPEYD
ncbi:hypothetical protein LOTGIDRAFT_111041, partial [Lottia gigantea]